MVQWFSHTEIPEGRLLVKIDGEEKFLGKRETKRAIDVGEIKGSNSVAVG